MQQITPVELKLMLDRGELAATQLIDVREDWERAQASLPGSLHLPLGQLPARLAEIGPARPLVTVCHHGIRSQNAGLFLEQRGYAPVYSLAGGLDAWSQEVDPALPRY